MKTCLYKPVFVNPQAYFVFPQLYDMQPKTDNFVEQAIFTGRLIITDLTNNQYTSYQNINTIDFSQYADKRIKIEQYTDTGAVVLGEWIISQDTTEVKPIASYRNYDNTNDDADRDVMKDLTGNGHDIQLYNFGFAESSGYGKYEHKLNVAYQITMANCIYKMSRDYTSVNYSFLGENYQTEGAAQFFGTSYTISNPVKVEIKGLTDNITMSFIEGKNSINIPIEKDGIYTIPAFENGYYPKFAFNSNCPNNVNVNITIKLIPDYQGALVSDGVDDYGLCENFPDLPIDKGFTVCAMRKWINQSPNTNAVFLNTRTSDNSGVVWGPFNIEKINVSGGVPQNYSIIPYGKTIGNDYKLPINNKPFVYCTSSKYNDIILKKGDNNVQGNVLGLFSGVATGAEYSSIALYALEIYDRDLTDEEIATVKARMIAEYEEKTGNKYEEETV